MAPEIPHDKEVNYSPMDWVFLLLGLGFQFALLFFVPDWSWVGLPFWMTYLVKSFRQL